MVWSFGLNRNVPVLNLTDPTRKVIMYTCAHVGILYDFKSNRQHILQGHVSTLTLQGKLLCHSQWRITLKGKNLFS